MIKWLSKKLFPDDVCGICGKTFPRGTTIKEYHSDSTATYVCGPCAMGLHDKDEDV